MVSAFFQDLKEAGIPQTRSKKRFVQARVRLRDTVFANSTDPSARERSNAVRQLIRALNGIKSETAKGKTQAARKGDRCAWANADGNSTHAAQTVQRLQTTSLLRPASHHSKVEH